MGRSARSRVRTTAGRAGLAISGAPFSADANGRAGWTGMGSSAAILLVYLVVSPKTEKAVETFVRHDHAERFLGDIRADNAERSLAVPVLHRRSRV